MIDLLTSEDCRVVRATSDLFNNLEWWGDLTWPTKRQRQRHTYKDTQDMMFELAEVNLGAKVWKKQRRLSALRLSAHQKWWNKPKVVLKCRVFLSLCLKGRALRQQRLGKLSCFGQQECFLGKKCIIKCYILHIILNQICKFAIECKNDAIVAKIADTCLTTNFVAIFALGERLPTSATLLYCFTKHSIRCLQMQVKCVNTNNIKWF